MIRSPKWAVYFSETNEMLSCVEEVLKDLAAGKMVIITDDEDRENEGDLVMAADLVEAEHINFMAKYGRGLICLTLTEERCQRLGLPLMVGNNNARFSTNFTVSIEAAEGVTTGISAADRAKTVRDAVAAEAKEGDIVMPGHIFPIMAQPGGVLSRAGHTEAGCDFSRLAGREPAGVICEILNEDGTMARMNDLVEFAKTHDLKICSIAELIRYRLEREPTVQKVHDSVLETPQGLLRSVVFNDIVRDESHLAFIKGEINPEVPIPVRVHVESEVVAVLNGLYGKKSWSTSEVMDFIQKEGNGILVILRYEQDDNEMLTDIKKSSGESKPRGDDHLRLLGAGSQILANLGVKKMRVIGTPKKMHGLSGFDLEITDYIDSLN